MRSKFQLFTGASYQIPSSGPQTISFGEGALYNIKPDLQIAFCVFHLNLNTERSTAFAVGIVKNFGRVQ